VNFVIIQMTLNKVPLRSMHYMIYIATTLASTTQSTPDVKLYKLAFKRLTDKFSKLLMRKSFLLLIVYSLTGFKF